MNSMRVSGRKRLKTTAILASVVGVGTLVVACGAPSNASSLGNGPSHFSWKAAKGQTINVLLNEHPYEQALVQQIPQFEKLTGM